MKRRLLRATAVLRTCNRPVRNPLFVVLSALRNLCSALEALESNNL